MFKPNERSRVENNKVFKVKIIQYIDVEKTHLQSTTSRISRESISSFSSGGEVPFFWTKNNVCFKERQIRDVFCPKNP